MLKNYLSRIRSILHVLPERDRTRIYLVLVLQSIMSLLDLLGVALIGILGALAVNGVQSRSPGNRVGTVLRILNLEDLEFQQQVAVLAIVAVGALMVRTVFSVIFTRRVLFFLSRRAAELSGSMISKLFSLPLLKTRELSSQETLFAVTSGVSAVVLGVIGTGVSVVADFSLLLVLGVGLFVVDPTVAIGTYILFVGIGVYLYKHMSVKARFLGANNTRLTILSNERILEVLNTYREAFVRNRRQFYAREISATRLEIAETLASQQFMPNIGKYVIETTLVLGAFLISSIQFITQDATHAVATLSVFLAAGTRIAPAILRIQQGAISIRGGVSSATLTLTLVERLKNIDSHKHVGNEEIIDFSHTGFSPDIEIQNAYVLYPEKSEFTLSNLSLSIKSGEMVAIVGESGAGKTTLVDLLLGLIEPDKGEVNISGENASDAISKWPGAIGYVPQDCWLIDGTIAENVALGFLDVKQFSREISLALDIAQLSSFVETLPSGIFTPVGERGTRLSGGQRQRLGIARALFTSPKLLVLDEATSALDGQTELEITNALQKLKGESTVIIIAHRLSTILNADKVVYMKNGSIIASGPFKDVRNSVKEFDAQLTLMGL